VISRDITERRRAEERLARQRVELERSNADLERFSYVASHDLQEPLRMVSNFVSLLGQRYRGRLDEDADEFIGFAVDGATRMSAMINDLLAYSRAGGAREAQPVDCEEALVRATRNLAAAIGESGAVVTHDPLPTVTAEPLAMTQVFQNLISNAIKFRRDGQAPRIHVGARRERDECVLSVEDNGIGIDPADQERVFEIFRRLHARDRYAGTGIGLAICQRIVHLHGGRIWLESEAGAGSTFSFALPAAGTEDGGT
jgi:light-regulated signal transduction histidine kinase (bacteriophytochrome)